MKKDTTINLPANADERIMISLVITYARSFPDINRTSSINKKLNNLSELKDIKHYDDEVGSITVEPGVTQQSLYDFLENHGSKHMVPTTGAGPSASILGNACERGYGITPETDHFNAIYEMEIILPSGETLCWFEGIGQ